MYNKEIKEAFINAIDRNESSKTQYLTMFNKVEPYENKLSKDLYDMDMDDLDDLFYKLKRRTSRSAVQFFNLVKAYISWAKDNGYSESSLHPIVDVVNHDFVEKYLYKVGVSYYTRDELIEASENLLNVKDKALVMSLFEGISGESYSEIINLKYDDLKKEDGRYFAEVMYDEIDKKTRQVEITEHLYNLLIETYETKETKNKNGGKSRVVDGEYIFRKNRVGSDGDIRYTFGIVSTKQMTLIKDAFDDKNINATRIINSGLMWYSNEMMDEKRVLTKDIVKKLTEKFDLTVNNPNGTKYASYTRFKERIDIDYMVETYGDFKIDF